MTVYKLFITHNLWILSHYDSSTYLSLVNNKNEIEHDEWWHILEKQNGCNVIAVLPKRPKPLVFRIINSQLNIPKM